MARVTERQGSLALGGATLDFERKLWQAADNLRRHGYPSDKQDAATDLVIEQAELLGTEWAA